MTSLQTTTTSGQNMKSFINDIAIAPTGNLEEMEELVSRIKKKEVLAGMTWLEAYLLGIAILDVDSVELKPQKFAESLAQEFTYKDFSHTEMCGDGAKLSQLCAHLIFWKLLEFKGRKPIPLPVFTGLLEGKQLNGTLVTICTAAASLLEFSRCFGIPVVGMDDLAPASTVIGLSKKEIPDTLKGSLTVVSEQQFRQSQLLNFSSEEWTDILGNHLGLRKPDGSFTLHGFGFSIQLAERGGKLEVINPAMVSRTGYTVNGAAAQPHNVWGLFWLSMLRQGFTKDLLSAMVNRNLTNICVAKQTYGEPSQLNLSTEEDKNGIITLEYAYDPNFGGKLEWANAGRRDVLLAAQNAVEANQPFYFQHQGKDVRVGNAAKGLGISFVTLTLKGRTVKLMTQYRPVDKVVKIANRWALPNRRGTRGTQDYDPNNA